VRREKERKPVRFLLHARIFKKKIYIYIYKKRGNEEEEKDDEEERRCAR